jgi:hypothetical protein
MNIGEKRTGIRVHDLNDDWSNLVEGGYAKLNDGMWAIFPPGGMFGHLSPHVHTITEHEDGTITASPSILYNPWKDGTHGWHGYLERGVWRRV